MADVGVTYTLTTPGGTVTFNTGTVYQDINQLYITEITGLGGAPVRRPIDPVPFGDGGIVHDQWKGPRFITIEGVMLTLASKVMNNWVIARNTFEAALITAWESILQADGTLAWTPQGQSANSLTVRTGPPDLDFRHQDNYLLEGFSFGLVAASPNF